MNTKRTKADIRRLVAAINHQSTGFTPRVYDRVQRIALKLAEGDANTQELAEALNLNDVHGGACQQAIRACRAIGIVSSRCVGATEGRGRGRNVHSLDVAALRAFNAQKRRERPSLFDRLSAVQRQILERVDWRKTKLKSQQDWWHVGRICARVGRSRTCKRIDLANELGVSESTITEALLRARKLRILRYGDVWTGGVKEGIAIEVEWNRLKSMGKGKGERGSDLAPLRRRTRVHQRGQKSGRLTPSQRKVLDAVDWKAAGIPTRHQWENILVLIGAICESRVVNTPALARELKTSTATIKVASRHARGAGFIVHRTTYEDGVASSARIVNWDRLEAFAGERSVATGEQTGSDQVDKLREGRIKGGKMRLRWNADVHRRAEKIAAEERGANVSKSARCRRIAARLKDRYGYNFSPKTVGRRLKLDKA